MSADGQRLGFDDVVALVRRRPWADHEWAREEVAAFPDRFERILTQWRLTVSKAHLDGVGFPVLTVERAGAPSAVVKFGGAGTDLAHQAKILEVADGRGYVRLLDYDAELDVALLEHLGPTLAHTRTDPAAQAEILAELLRLAWEVPLEAGTPYAPDEKARTSVELLKDEHARHREAVERSPHAAVVERALRQAEHLASNPRPDQVVVHGDPHSLNALQRESSFALIDPDGFRCEREYDAGVVLRDCQHIIDEIDLTDAPGSGGRWHRRLVNRIADRLELDRDRTAAWAFVERVTTGIWLGRLGYAEESNGWLNTAARIDL